MEGTDPKHQDSGRVLAVTPAIGVASFDTISLWQNTADYAWQTETQTGIKFTVENAREVFPVARKVSTLRDRCWPSGLVSEWISS